MKLSKAVFLDFDGVLFDTVKEAYTVCLFAMGRVEKTEDVDYESDVFKIFERYRYLIGPAWNYFYLLKVIDKAKNSNEINVEDEYLSQIGQAESHHYREFEERFFTKRQYLKENHEDFWLGLNTPYGFLSSLSSLINKYPHNFFIITTKDDGTILKLMEINGQDFNPQNIYGRDSFERFKTKSSIIRNIMRDYSIKDAIFIDDNIFHLSDCNNLNGLRLLQPRWGYISSKDEVFSEDHVLPQIKKLLEGA